MPEAPAVLAIATPIELHSAKSDREEEIEQGTLFGFGFGILGLSLLAIIIAVIIFGVKKVSGKINTALVTVKQYQECQTQSARKELDEEQGTDRVKDGEINL